MIKAIKRIKHGDTYLPENMIFCGGNKEKYVPIILSVFYVETDTKRILIDAGCETMPGFKLENFKTPLEALREQGIDPEEITDVIITHSHHDHIDCVRYYKNATVYINIDELEKGRRFIPDGMNVVTFSDEIEVDNGIKVIKIGGHSVGSSVVEIDFNGKKYIVCGDECYSFYNVQNKVPTAASFNKQNSRKFIETYCSGEYNLLLCHME
jgi:glyoxylase-like metal-dependent hydrolase (beta-lactamase superfamily II)